MIAAGVGSGPKRPPPFSIDLRPDKFVSSVLPDSTDEPLSAEATARLVDLFRAPELSTAIERGLMQERREGGAAL